MISERKFAERFTSFWHNALPRGAVVSRYINLQKTRFDYPLQSEIPADRRAVVNELGFRLFAEQIQEGRINVEVLHPDHLDRISRAVVETVRAELPLPARAEVGETNSREIEEANLLAQRLAEFFLEYVPGETLVPTPEFAGCGILESCQGDVLAGATLYELKSGEGNFRLTDLRQVLIYCALNHAFPRYSLRDIGLLNPRKGVFYTANVDDLVRWASGASADNLFFEMTHFLTSQGIST